MSIREAASVILLRATPNGFEVFLLRRHKKASFMASAFVFPGGATEPGEDALTAAARELFEEAGVLLARDTGSQNETLELMSQEQLRHKVLTGVPAQALLEIAGLAWELAHYSTIADVFAAAKKRAEEPHPIMPRLAPGDRPTLLLPWDVDYNDKGTGEATPLAYKPSWAIGPSRFMLEDKTWKYA